ncbi:MAG: GtrA family protein [Tidjanibacter sp.]|nr:GtrA family protein [Tidjanibacter sp.]
MKIQEKITKVIDFFYVKPLRRFVPLQTFRYAMCGGANLVLNWLVYALLYDVVLGFDYLNVGIGYVSRHIAALAITFPITLITGYLLQSRISFAGSPLGDRVSGVRYLITTLGSLAINYACLKLFVEVCDVYAPVAQIVTSLITIIYSYLLQKFWTFKGA